MERSRARSEAIQSTDLKLCVRKRNVNQTFRIVMTGQSKLQHLDRLVCSTREATGFYA